MNIKKPFIYLGIFVLILLVGTITFLVITNININNLNESIKNNIDNMFSSNFSMLTSSLHELTTQTEDEESVVLEMKRAEYVYLLANLISNTSYANDSKLRDIVHSLSQMFGSKAIHENDLDSACIEQLTYLSLHLDSPEAVTSAWSLLCSK